MGGQQGEGVFVFLLFFEFVAPSGDGVVLLGVGAGGIEYFLEPLQELEVVLVFALY